uniref:Reverse transcriptase domain-containing protein n=1 Tax=Tanacetum cinerariifolium TaxID=118510 RepID=A0A6L2JE88_TANCI|nr:reverse transcriptase domain-containing protein [Tanacetum cinerariifolium]
MAANESCDSESDEEEPKFEKITINTGYKIQTSLEEPPMDLELKPLPDNLEYVLWKNPIFFLPWVSPIHCVSKKGGITVVTNENDELVLARTIKSCEVDDNFLGEILMEINTRDEPWFADFANYLVGDSIPKGMAYQQKNKFFSGLKYYFWEESYLFKVCSDGTKGGYLNMLFPKVGSTTLNDKVIVTLSNLKCKLLQQGQLSNSAVGTLLH